MELFEAHDSLLARLLGENNVSKNQTKSEIVNTPKKTKINKQKKLSTIQETFGENEAMEISEASRSIKIGKKIHTLDNVNPYLNFRAKI